MCFASKNLLDLSNPFSDDKGVLGKLALIGDPAGKYVHKEGDKLLAKPEIPDPPPPPPLPQAAKAPNTMPLKRRNADGGFALPSGSTVLTGPSGVALSQLNLGGVSALGG